jgi:hypothetical protein
MRNSKLQKSDFVTRVGEMITSAAWNNNLEEMKVLLSNPSCNVNVQNERSMLLFLSLCSSSEMFHLSDSFH